MALGAGDLKWRIGFYAPIQTDDGFGNLTNGFAADPDFTVWANRAPKLGGEAVVAGRLQGKNYENITVRKSIEASTVTTDWKAKDENSGEIFNIRSIIDPDGKNQWIEMLCEKGVAV